jgi:preprotein translocase subunit SecA
MTGTAQTEAAALHQIYNLAVVPNPTNRSDFPRPFRPDQQDRGSQATSPSRRCCGTEKRGPAGADRHHLVERPSTCRVCQYTKRRIPAQRAQRRSTTSRSGDHRRGRPARRHHVATNIAGRGTDIVARGNPDFLFDKRLRDRVPDPGPRPRIQAAWHEMLPKVKPKAPRRPRSHRRRRLYVLGTERTLVPPHRQPAARPLRPSGRPGRVAFYLSLGDELMRRFQRRHPGDPSDPAQPCPRTPIEPSGPPVPSRARRPGRAAELREPQERPQIRRGENRSARHLHRSADYPWRARTWPAGTHMKVRRNTAYVDGATAEGYSRTGTWRSCGRRSTLYPISIDHRDLIDSRRRGTGELPAMTLDAQIMTPSGPTPSGRSRSTPSAARCDAPAGAPRAAQRPRPQVGEHLYEMDYLQEARPRAMAQRYPLVEYQREATHVVAMLRRPQ